MVQLDIAGLRNPAHCMPFINKICALQRDGVYGPIPDRNWVLASLLPDRKMNILDIGACNFVFNELLSRERTALYDYHTLDIEASDVKPAWVHEHLHDGNLPGYPVPDDYFDLIICSDVIEHIREQDVLLDECSKKLKKDGILFLTTPNYANLPSLRNILLGRMLHDPCGNELEQYCFREHVRYYTTRDLIPFLAGKNFHTSHVILYGLVTVLPGKGPLTRFLVSTLYNRLCLFRSRFSHQTTLILQKSPVRPKVIRCPLITVQR